MASENKLGEMSTTAPPLSSTLSEAATTSFITPITHSDPEPTRTKSLKRARQEQSQNPNLTSIAHAGLGASPSAKSPRYKGNFTPMPLTGAAALEDQRRARENQKHQPIGTSENPTHKALSSLMAGGGSGMSKIQDAPSAATAMSEGLSAAANSITIPTTMVENPETSPASVTSLASLGSTAPTAMATPTLVASPSAISSAIEAEALESRPSTGQPQMPEANMTSNKGTTYPGNVHEKLGPPRAPGRGMSLPMPGQTLAPRSPSTKKHKCPYCETEFTRHHNLKSHLLTHSQEKPYLCQTCQMRFRRLHDLKRHMKLHTGERPHICPKCDRKFARGDALARHSKGQGGCAGRRASMGSFGGDDDYDGSNAGDGDDTAMDGIMYTNGTPHPNENEMSEEDRRRFSLPAIKAQHVNAGSGDHYAAQSRTPSTYPPAGPRPGQSTGGLYPPNADRGGSSSSGTSPSIPGGHSPNTSISSMPINTGGHSMYSQSGMTESPKPLSPGGMHSHQLGQDSSLNRQRSPSLTTQFQQQHFGRRQSGRASPTGMSLPSPHGAGPKLPALAGLAPPEQRYTLSNQPNQHGPPTPGPTSPSTMYQAQGGSVPGRGGHQGSGSGDSGSNLFASGERGVWTYAQTLEGQVKQLSDKVLAMESKEKSQEDKINRLEQELFSLRNQLNSLQQQS